MIPALVVFLYLAVVLYIGIFAFRTSRTSNAEDYFLAGRSLGPTVFLLSLFGTNSSCAACRFLGWTRSPCRSPVAAACGTGSRPICAHGISAGM